MAVSDIIEMAVLWPAERVAAVDHLLRNEGLPTLTEMRVRCSRVIRRVATRGSIKNEVEYYAVRNAAELAEDDDPLWKLLTNYEDKAAN